MARKHDLTRTLERNSRLNKSPGSTSEKHARTVMGKDIASGYYANKQNVNNLLNQDEQTLAIMGKQLRGENTKREDTSEDIISRNSETFRQVYNRIVCNKARNKKSVSLFPDLETAIEIIVSSTLSPNRMTEVILNYTFNDTDLITDDGVRTDIINVISDEVENTYKVAENLTEDVKDVLMISGSRPRMIVSENTTDDIINYDIVSALSGESYDSAIDYGMEQLIGSRGILGNLNSINSKTVELDPNEFKNKEEVTMEDAEKFIDYLTSGDNVRVTDNINILKLGKIESNIRSRFIREQHRTNSVISSETSDKFDQLYVFRDRKIKEDVKPVVAIHSKNKATRRSLGRPMVVSLPSESVCPVCTPGNKDDHVGYFVMLDGKGRPVTGDIEPSAFEQLNQNLHKVGTFNTNSITDVYTDLIGNGGGSTCIDVEKLHSMYESVMEKQIYELFMDSMYGEDVEIPNINTLMFIMFSRALQGQKTTLLYVPKENMSYFAMFLDEYGLGKSLLDDLTVIISFRSILLFARVMSQLRNSIDITTVSIDLEPSDPDPEETIEMIKEGVYKMMANNFPLGESDPTALLDWIQKAGMRFVPRNHPDIPEMEINFDKSGMSYAAPDDELDNRISEQMFGKIGVPAEVISRAYTADFATEILKRSTLYSKRTITYHALLNPEITKYVRSLVYNDEVIRGKIKDILIENKGVLVKDLPIEYESLRDKDEDLFIERMVDDLIEQVDVKLPKLYEGDTEEIDNQFRSYVDRIDSVFDAIFNSDLFSDEQIPGISNQLDFIKNVIRVTLIRDWAAENNYLPELFSLIGGGDGSLDDLIQNNNTYIKTIYNVTVSILKDIEDIKLGGGIDIEYLTKRFGDLFSKKQEDIGSDGFSSGGSDWSDDVGGDDDEDDEESGDDAGMDDWGGDDW